MVEEQLVEEQLGEQQLVTVILDRGNTRELVEDQLGGEQSEEEQLTRDQLLGQFEELQYEFDKTCAEIDLLQQLMHENMHRVGIEDGAIFLAGTLHTIAVLNESLQFLVEGMDEVTEELRLDALRENQEVSTLRINSQAFRNQNTSKELSCT